MFSKKLLCAAVLSALLPLCAFAGTPEKTYSGKLDADTALATTAGIQVTGPMGWSVRRDGKLTYLEAPEAGNRIVLVDVDASDAGAAIRAAWERIGSKTASRQPSPLVSLGARRGWDERVVANYTIPSEEKALAEAVAMRIGKAWTVMLIEGGSAVMGKRGPAVRTITSSVAPEGYRPENFAGKQPNRLDAARVAQFRHFLTQAMKDAGVPGLGYAVLEGGKIIHAEGLGVREQGKPALVDENTLFMAASTTKGMTTLLMAKLADQGKLRWDQPVVELYPSFKLGTEALTSQVLVKHMVCACTGLPRRDMEGIFEFKNRTALTSIAELGTHTPTSGFGELFQNNNLIVSVAGFVAGSLAFPGMELGKAYDKAMQDHLFTPLGMRNTTFDMSRALRGNHATPHVTTLAGQVTPVASDLNHYVVPHRPSGGVWTSAADFARYVQIEATAGKLPDGNQLVSKENVLARHAPQIAAGKNRSYGMGLATETVAGIKFLNHDGALAGYESSFFLLPESGTGVAILTNSGEGGWLMRPAFRRLLELLFDAQPEAADDVRRAAAREQANRAATAMLNTLPADAAIASQLAPRYHNLLLGELSIRRRGKGIVMDVGEWESELATRKHANGKVSLIPVSFGKWDMELMLGLADGQRTITINTAQQEYRFTEVK